MRKYRFYGRFFLSLFVGAILLNFIFSQFVVADINPLPIYGKVTYNGKGMAGVEIEATNERTGGKISEKSSSDGSYSVTFGGPVYPWEIGDTIILKARGTGNYECLWGSKEITINSGEPIRADIALHLSLDAEFGFSPENPEAGENISFMDMSAGQITNRTWDFGDGNTSYEKDPVHVYSSGGNYTVTLTVYCHEFSDSFSSIINVHESSANSNGTETPEGENGTPDFMVASVISSFLASLIILKKRECI
ncbi:MAG: hypothetical protein DRN33_05665 [Thermoplasmata archaeon]|nr:MAG: hypothetical protein DRN33_05665 [Thermoplasmata archaeon]